MAKQSGLGSALYVAQYDLSGDIGSVSSMEAIRGVFDVTSIAASAAERIGGRRDGNASYVAFWNTVAGAAHLVESALARTDQIISVFLGTAIGQAGASMVAKQLGYSPSMGGDGSLTATINASANANGLEFSGGLGDGILTTGKQTVASGNPFNGASIDYGSVSSLFGASGYLHVFSVGSGTPTVAIQDSADNVTFANVTGLVFTASPAATSEFKQTATNATIRRYVRMQITGVYTNCVLAVNFVRYLETIAT